MGVIAICSGGDTPVRIDTSQIPAVEVQILSATFLDAVQRFYENPDNIRRFEEWRNKRNGGKTNEESRKNDQGSQKIAAFTAMGGCGRTERGANYRLKLGMRTHAAGLSDDAHAVEGVAARFVQRTAGKRC